MDQSEADLREIALKSDPNDLTSRLLLLGFYGDRKTQQNKFFQHMLWMIDMRPGDYICNDLGDTYGLRLFAWTKSRERKATALWLRQIRKHNTNVRVLCNAASFFEKRDPAMCERLYKRAKNLDLQFALPARRLAYQYRLWSSSEAGKERARLVHLALNEVDDALTRKDGRGERIGLIQEFASTAIKFGYLERGERYAKMLRYYGEIFHLWKQYAYICLAWLDFKHRRTRGLNFKINKLRGLFEENPSHVASSSKALSFVADIVNSGQTELALKVLEVLIDGEQKPENKRELLEWAAAIRSGRKPKLKVLKKKMDWLF